MAQVYNYILLMSGIALLFYIFGLVSETGTLIDLVVNFQDITKSNLHNYIITGIVGLSLVGLAVFSLFVADPTLIKFAAVATYLISLGIDFLKIASVVWNVTPVFATIIFGPFTILYIIVVMDWWRKFN